MKRAVTVFAGMVVGLCGCDSSVGLVSENRPLVGTTWVVQYFVEIRGIRTAIGCQGVVLEFRADGIFQGRSYTSGYSDGGPRNFYGGGDSA
jgi:hypothetical protein